MGFDYQLALELSSMVLLLDELNSEAKTTRVEALKGLAAKETSPNGRNYYLTQVRIMIGLSGKETSPNRRNYYLTQVKGGFVYVFLPAILLTERSAVGESVCPPRSLVDPNSFRH